MRSRFNRTAWEVVESITGETVAAVWVDVAKLGEVWQNGTRYPLEQKHFDEIRRNFSMFREIGYVQHIARQHLDDGYTYGEIHELRQEGEYLQALVSLATPEDRKAYNAGQIRHWSPGIDWNTEHPHTGDNIGASLFHLAYVSEPQQKNLRYAQRTNPGVELAAAREAERMKFDPVTFGTQAAALKAEFDLMRDSIEANKVEFGRSSQAASNITNQITKLQDSLAPLVEIKDALAGLMGMVSGLVAEEEAVADVPAEEPVEMMDGEEEAVAEVAEDEPVVEMMGGEEEEENKLAAGAEHAPPSVEPVDEAEVLRQEIAKLKAEKVEVMLNAHGIEPGPERDALAKFGAIDSDGLGVLLLARQSDAGTVGARQKPTGFSASAGGAVGIEGTFAEYKSRFGENRGDLREAILREKGKAGPLLLQWSRLHNEIARFESMNQPTRAAALKEELAGIEAQYNEMERG